MAITIHILYVGRGDCVIIEFSDGQLVMVDTNFAAHTTDALDYLKNNFPGRQLSLFVLTHPHPHRFTGLSRIRKQVGFESFWDASLYYQLETWLPEWQQKSAVHRADWDDYLKIRDGGLLGIEVLGPQRGYKLIVSDGEELEILAPSEELQKQALQAGNDHIASYVLGVRCHQNQAILGGSANAETWQDIHEQYGKVLKAGLLIASHHGHRDGFYKPAVKAISPEFVVVSSEMESYADASGLYSRYCSGVISTAHLGNIVARCYPSGGVELQTQY